MARARAVSLIAVLVAVLCLCASAPPSRQTRGTKDQSVELGQIRPYDREIDGNDLTLNTHGCKFNGKELWTIFGCTWEACNNDSKNFGLLASRNVYKSGTFLIKHEEKVSFTLSTGIISYIKIDDLMKNGKNAEVKVKSGGVGYREVTLKFKSQRGGKINYIVSVYGQ